MVLVGAHVSAAGGVFEAVGRSAHVKGTCFSLFLKNEKRWTGKPYTSEVITKFKAECKAADYDQTAQVLPHGSYLINLGNPDMEKRKKSMEGLLDELQRCELLGIGLFNMHPGSSLGSSKETAIANIAAGINESHKKTESVCIVLENMTGNPDRIVGTRLEDLASIISLVDNKQRVGVCIDTCHSLAAGYDMRTKQTFDEFWERFDKIVGFKYLKALHVNDSKHPLSSHRDVHQSIGRGFLGLEAFRLIMNSPQLENVPKILETPSSRDDSSREGEINLLKWLVGREKDDPEFIEREKELSDKGRGEREEVEAKEVKPAKQKKEGQTKLTKHIKSKEAKEEPQTKRVKRS